jgi:hypothetical protein
MKSTAYGKWFPRRIRPQNGHGNSVGTARWQRDCYGQEGAPPEGGPYTLERLYE